MLKNHTLLEKKPQQTKGNMNTHLSSRKHLKNIKTQLFFTSILLFLVNFSFAQLSLENFNSGIPSGWAVTSNLTVTNNWISNATGGYQATGGASVNPASNNTVGTTAQYFMISPQFLTPENGEIRFFTKQGSFTNRGATYQVRISTANQPDITGFNVVLQSWTETQLNVSATTYEEKIVPIPSLPPGIPVYIAFVAVTNQTGTTATSGDTWFVDNVRVIPECTPITGITTNLTSQTAQINWTHPTATNFSIQVVPNGVGIAPSGTPVSGASYLASGLTANTTYDAWIRTDCDATTFSSWAGPFTFTTPQVGLNCAAPIIIPSDVSTTPYVLSSNLANYYSTTDYTPYTTVGSNCFPSGTMNQLLGNHVFFNYTPTTTGLIDITQSVTVISGGGPNACYNGLSSVMVFNSCADVGVSCLAAIRTGTSSNESLTAQISNFYVVAGHTYVIVMSSPYDQSQSNASLCFTFTVSGSTCPAPAPSGTTYNNLTQTSVDFSWGNVGNLVSAWEYVALPVAFGAPTGSTVLTSTSTNLNNPVSGLTPATNYNLYVRSVCGGTPGPWSTPLPFTTPCNPYTPPYYTGFTNAAETECWSQLNLNNDLNFFTFGNNAFSEPVAKIRPQNSNDMLISPQFHFDGVTQKRLRFKYNIYGNWGTIASNPPGGPGSFEIRMSTTGIGPNNFTTVLVPLAQYTTVYNFIEMMVPLPNVVGDVHIAWVLPEGAVQTGIQTYFDDVYIEDLPACSEPSYPTVTPGSITTTSATISWTNGYNNTQWELVAQPLGTGTPTVPGIIVNTNPYTLTGLIPSTRYEFYMRAVCSSTEQSIWVGPINFNTLCIAQNTPYYESLNDADVNTKKFCWSVINNSDELTRWRIEATEAQIRAASTMFEPFVNFDDWLVSAPINAVGLKRLRFNHRAVNGIFNPTPRGNVEVLMSSTPDFSTYSVIIPSFDFTNIAYQEKSALFTGTGTTYIAFRVPPTMADPSNSGIMMIDDVYIDDAPPCPDPTNLAVSNITTSTANLSWAPGYLETQWQVAIQPAGTGTPTGSGTNVNTTSTYNATGLTPNTQYEYYVRANCDANGYSSWVGPIAFRTDCNPIATPFLETFDSTSTTESCWKIVNGNGDGNDWFLNQTVEPIFGNQMAALFTGSNGDNNEWLITPTLTVQPNQRLRFYFKVYDGFFEEDLKVMLSTNGSSINQFTTVLYENSLNTYTDANGVTAGSNTITLDSTQDVRVGDFIYIPGFPFPYPTYVAAVNGTQITMTTSATITQTGVQNVQFEHEALNNEEPREFVINLTDITAPTNINLAFHTPFFDPNPWAYRGQYTFIDNVIIEDIPVCPSVINVTTSNIIDTSVKINWEPVGTETSWEISVQPYGTPAPVGNTLPQYLTTTSTHPKTITGLTPATQYQYYVRAICSGTSQSEWVGPFEFTTLCDFANLCEYTITTISGNTGQVSQSVNVMQNGVVNQILEFPGFNQTELTYTVFLCSGVAFDLYWDGLGSGVQYSQAQIIIKDASNNVIWTSPLGLGTVNTNIYSGFATCGPITCPEPTNLSVSNQGVFSWTPGASETQWEVFVQPIENGTLPQSGTIVNSPSYTPIATDFVDPSASTYEYFVRAICSATNKSYWSGPKVFIRNDEETTSVHLPVNSGTTCDASGIDVSFIGATPSTTPTACEGTNGGDVWFDFVATSKIHTIELSDFTPGSYYASSFEGPWPRIIMSLYEVQTNGSLVEKGCSDNNSFVASYSSELVVGQTYKIRLKLNDVITNNKKFHICITTPTELCDLDAFNYNFEKLPMQYVTGISTIINALVVPGWRVNTVTGQMFYQEANNSLNVTPYSGGQCIQLIQDGAAAWDPNDPNIKGLYKDFDTSEISEMAYSFASATRTSSSTVQLYAGPPSGPFTLVTEHTAVSLVWQLVQGTYTVPVGQTTTRFIFRVKDYTIGHLLDAANFKAKVNIDIATAPTTLDCVTTSLHLDAHGVGHWEADVTNPGTATIATPNSTSTDITGVIAPGDYVFHWITRYCDKTITITKQGTNAVAAVNSPVNYCVNQSASALTATVPSGNTLMWYTQATGGTGSTTAPTPSTAISGNTSYYVCAVDGNGCEGTRTEIVVQVEALPTASIAGDTTICSGGTATVTFTGTPNATVTYTVDSGANQTITLDATGTATITAATLTSNSVYSLVSATASGTLACSQAQTGSATITVAPLPTASISGSTNVCPGSTAVISFTGTPNATITYTVDLGANQTITLDDTGNATVTTPTLNTNSTYTLVSVTAPGALACSQNQTGSATVTVVPLPTATIAGTTTICSGSTTTITFTGTPNATITYSVDSGANQTITLDASGNASVTTPALTSDSTYTLVSVASAGTPSCSQLQTGSAIVSVIALPTATISGSTTICSGGTATITFTGTPNAIVTYTVDSGANQTVTLDASGNATVTTSALSATSIYTLVNVASAGTPSCSQSVTSSASITVEPLPTATISASTSTCSGTTVIISITGTPNATVTYTVDSGANQTIILDGTGNASITTPVLSATSTYSLVNITSSGTPSCTQTLTNSSVITVNNPTPQNLVFSYNPTCINAASNPLPTLTPNFTTGGVFSSSTLTVNSLTGEITLSSATIGTHQVTYTSLNNIANCTQGGSYTASITINSGVAAVVTFDYDNSYCSSATNATPTTTVGFTTGGTFSSTAGLIVNSTTGEINIAQSTPGTYTITYTVATNSATCTIGGSFSDTIIIAAPIAVSIESSCDEQSMILKANPVSNSFDPNTVNYTWVNGNNTVVGSNSQTLSIDDYFADYPNAVFPLTFTVTVDASGCIGTASFTITDNPCKLIPKGISPNDDGDNDTFDLTGLGVKEVTIFNRYGTKVYSFSGNYTNQWKGLSDNGNDLPDGTYFYNIVKDNDVTIVGWVYINR